MPEHKRVYPTKDNFLHFLTNKDLEPYASALYEFLRKAWSVKHYNEQQIGRDLHTLQSYTHQLQELARFYKFACDPQKLGKRFKITHETALKEIKFGIQKGILACLDSLYRRIDLHVLVAPLEPDNQKNFNLWVNYLKGIPYPEEILENTGDHLVDEGVMNEVFAFIERAPKDMADSITISADDVTKDFLRYAKDLGIKMNSEAYRELYDILDMFALIPEEQYQYHMKFPGSYMRENYIKMKVRRLQ